MFETITPAYCEQNAQLHRERPDYGKRSARHIGPVLAAAKRLRANSVLDYGCGKGHLVRALPVSLRVQGYDPAIPSFTADPLPAELTVCTDVLEHIEPHLLDSVLEHLASRTIREAYIVVATKPDGSKTLPDGRDPHLTVQPSGYWELMLENYFDRVVKVGETERDATFCCTAPLTICTWQWGEQYTIEHVNRLHNQIRENYDGPFRFVAFTDKADGLHPLIAHAQIPTQHADVPNPMGAHMPKCYRRLWLFSEQARHTVGDRLVNMDLDVDIVGNLAPLLDGRDHEFRAWADPSPRQPYNGSFWMLKTGSRSDVWTGFDPTTSPRRTAEARLIGSDQAWMAYVMGKSQPTWTASDGILSYKADLKSGDVPTPLNARVIVYHGSVKPWSTS